MDIGHYFALVISAIFINNFVLTRFLGICPYIGVSKKLDSAIGMGFAVTFVMTMASAITWLVFTFLLNSETNLFGGSSYVKLMSFINTFLRNPEMNISESVGADLSFLRTIAFIVVIAALVQFVEMVIQKTSPVLNNSLGIYLPLITTNCAVLGVAVLNVDDGFTFIQSIIRGCAAGLGFTLAIVLMAGLREKLEMADIPKPLRGVPIAFIMASLMSLAFMGFNGLSLQ